MATLWQRASTIFLFVAFFLVAELLPYFFLKWTSEYNLIQKEKNTFNIYVKVCKILTLLLSYVVPVKSKVKFSQNFVVFSEYMNFNSGTKYYLKWVRMNGL